eukprot:341109_1
MNENKYDNSEDSDDDYQEVVVNGSDYREPIYEFESVRDVPIIKCIGQIRSEYNYQIENDFKQSAVGTGTVYKTRYNEAESAVFVLTCAHNIRLKVYSCNKCNTYNKSKECSKCNQSLNNNDKKLLKPTFMEFKRRTITETNFGRTEISYTCIEVYIPKAYQKNTILAKGFDFAILMFRDKDCYYTEHCHNIKLEIGTTTLQNHKKFNIFGYPGCDFANAKKNKLYGYVMKTEAQPKGIEFIECAENHGDFSKKIDYILRQRHVDASAGQSGSCLFVTGKNNETIIFAVHVGGHEKKKEKVNDYSYNIATLLSEEYVKILENATDIFMQHEKVQNLQSELDAAKEQIIALQMLLKEQQLKNNLYGDKEQKNPDPVQIVDTLKLDNFWLLCGSGMEMNGATITYHGWTSNTVYSSLNISHGVYEITFKIVHNTGCHIYIGIASTARHVNGIGFGIDKDLINYAYCTSGTKYSNVYENKKYGSAFEAGDIVTLHVDFNNLTIGFSHNEKHLGILSSIRAVKYQVAICVCGGISFNPNATIVVKEILRY